jgi:arylsulfatase A-like enzyme
VTVRKARLGAALLPVLVLALLVGVDVSRELPTAASDAPVAAAVRAAPRPNVVVVMADDMRVDELRFAPHVRRLVGRRGLTFANSFSPYPLCCPARASFLTGQYTHNHRVWSHERPWGYRAFDDSRTLATSLRRAGYRTGFIGKYLNGYGPQRSKVSGEPSWRYVPRGWTDWRASFEDPGVRGIHGGTYNYFDSPYNVNGRVQNGYRGRYQSTVIGDFSVGMARRFADARKPFFMYVNYVAPHFGGPSEPDDPRGLVDRNGRPWTANTPARPDWVKGRFDGVIRRAAGLPRGGGPAEAGMRDKPPRLRRLPEPTARERAAMRELTRQRAEAIFVLDREVARLVATLKRTGEWRRTVFVFTSDNGYFLGEHRRRQGKTLGYEPSLRVPLLVTGPGMRGDDEHGHTRNDPITTVDLAATVLDLAGATAPRPLDGASKVEVLRVGDRGWTVPVLHEAIRTGGRRGGGFDDVRSSIGIRTARYSMLLHRFGAELYDLEADALQNESRWRSEDYRAVRRQLRRVWEQVKDCAGASCRTPLPEGLAAGPAENRRLTRGYWEDVSRVYGW